MLYRSELKWIFEIDLKNISFWDEPLSIPT